MDILLWLYFNDHFPRTNRFSSSCTISPVFLPYFSPFSTAAASAGLLRLSYLSNDTQVQEGDIVTTSGVGGTYPADVIIGQVQSVQKSENDISNYAVIKPYEDLTSVQDVFVVIDFPGAGDGEEIPVGQDTSGEEDAE